MEGSASASAFSYHSRRNREYPSFSSALLEQISRSTESYTIEDEKVNRRRQEMKFSRDSSIGLPVCKEPRGQGRGRGRGGGSSSPGSSSDGVALEQTRTRPQPMSPGRRLVNFLNSLFMGMGKRKSKREREDPCASGKCPSINANWKYKYGEKDKGTAGAGQFKSVSVCSMSSVTSNYSTSTASTTSNPNSSRQLRHSYKFNPCSKNEEYAMKRYGEYSFIDHASSCSHDHPKPFKSSIVNNTRPPKNGIRRSVRFYPTANVRLDEYALPGCGEETLNRLENHYNKHSKHLRRVQSLEKDVIPSEYSIYYHQDLKYSNKFVQTKTKEDENGDSDSSSDLFELQNLNGAVLDMDIYSRELPVYETTNLETNRAIARGLL